MRTQHLPYTRIYADLPKSNKADVPWVMGSFDAEIGLRSNTAMGVRNSKSRLRTFSQSLTKSESVWTNYILSVRNGNETCVLLWILWSTPTGVCPKACTKCCPGLNALLSHCGAGSSDCLCPWHCQAPTTCTTSDYFIVDLNVPHDSY